MATLFDFGPEAYITVALALTAPTFAYVTFYLLGMSLKQFPGVKIAHEYTPPRWLLPSAALFLIFLLAASTAIFLTLRLKTAAPDTGEFMKRFHEENVLTHTDISLKDIKRATLFVDHYDNWSNVRVFVNNTRIFSSHYNCLMKYQCKKTTHTIPTLPKTNANLWSAHDYNQRNALTLERDFLNLLHPGRNIVHISQENSKFNLCSFRARIIISLADSDIIRENVIISSGNNIKKYETRREDVTYRLCGRYSYYIDISN